MMPPTRDLDQAFFAESADLLATAHAVLQAFELAGDTDQIAELHRCAHSIKGAALMLDFSGVGLLADALAHLLEHMGSLDDGSVNSLMPLVEEGFDAIQDMLAELSVGADRKLANDALRLRLSQVVNAPAQAFTRISFRLSPFASVSPFALENMLDELRQVARIGEIRVGDGHSGGLCWIELQPSGDLAEVMTVIERIADPGSACVATAGSVSVVTDEDSATSNRAWAQRSELKAIGCEGDASGGNSKSTGTQSYLTLQLGNRWFAVRLAGVEAVAAIAQLEPYPVLEAGVLGVAEVNGQFVKVFDLKALLGIDCHVAESGMQVIVSLGEERVGVQVDRAESIIELGTASLQSMPGLKRQCVDGLAHYRGAAVWVLDLFALVTRRPLSNVVGSEGGNRPGVRAVARDVAPGAAFSGLVSAYGELFDDSLRVRALALNLALASFRSPGGTASGLARDGLALMHSLSARLDVLGDELVRLAQVDHVTQTVGSSPMRQHIDTSASPEPLANGARGDKSASKATRSFLRSDDTSTAHEQGHEQGHRAPERTVSIRRPRASSAPLPRIGRGRNPLKEQWSD